MKQKKRVLPQISRRCLLQLAAITAGVSVSGIGSSLAWANQAVRAFENDVVIPLTPWLVNTYLLRAERPILIDTGFPRDNPVIQSRLRAHAVDPSALGLIIVTHGHYDHFGSAAAIKAEYSVPVAVHRADAPRLHTRTAPPVESLTTIGRLIGLFQTSRPAVPVVPDIIWDDEAAFDVPGTTARIIHTPGHTRGSVTVLSGGIAIIGDLLSGSLLQPNRPDFPWFIDDRDDQPAIVSSLARLIDEGAEIFFPGHGLPFNRAAVLTWLQAQR